MQNSLAHLSKQTRDELIIIRDNIKLSIPETTFIILFGSYARGSHVEYDQRIEHGVRKYFKSDYDILVITSESVEHKNIVSRLNAVSNLFYKKDYDFSNVPTIQFLTDTENAFIKALEEGRYFYCDIYTEGIMLYAQKELKFQKNKELSIEEKRKLAEEYFKHRLKWANSFLRCAKYDIKDMEYDMAAFHLNQATENYLMAMILTASLYAPKEHSLSRLLEISTRYTDVVNEIFPNDTIEEERLLHLLEMAYNDGRFNPDYKVQQEDIAILLKKIKAFKDICKKFYKEKIKEYSS